MILRKIMLNRIFLFLSILAFFLSACSGIKEEHTVLKLAHGLEPNHPVHIGMVEMATRLKEISGGKMEIEIYPSGQLGTEQQCVELLQIGSLAITKVSAAVLESFTNNF